MSSSLFLITDLIEWIDSRKISKSDNGWVMRCPFHEEATPSFLIKGDTFHCLSCEAKGHTDRLLVEFAHNAEEMLELAQSTEWEIKSLRDSPYDH